MAIYTEFSRKKWWFSIAMFHCQRVVDSYSDFGIADSQTVG